MKKLLVCLFLSLLVLCGAALAEEPILNETGDYYYVLLPDNTAKITKFNVGVHGHAGYAVPETVDGYPVSAIGSNAFQGAPLSRLVIPAGVTSIGDYAFYGCENLTEAVLPQSVIEIGENPFKYCGKLTLISVAPENPALATIDGVLFDKTERTLVCYPQGRSAASYAVPNGILSIGDWAFYCNKSLTEVVLPDSLTIVGERAFYGCSSLARAALPESLTSIGAYAFYGAKGLTEAVIPAGVVRIGENPFENCSKLVSITVSPENPKYETVDGVLFDKEEKRLLCYPGAFTAKSYTVPEGTLVIESCAFSYVGALEEVVIPDGVTIIGAGAFNQSASLKKVVMPDSLTSIGESAFFNVSTLVEADIPESVTYIGDKAFYSCVSLTKVVIPKGVTSLGLSTFNACENLVEVSLPEGLATIGDYVFASCVSLTELEIPASVSSMGVGVFKNDVGLTLCVQAGSYAEDYAGRNYISYKYPEADTDWLA